MAQLLLVVGIGRSGTSAVASVLAELGFHVPQPEVQADATNPRGFGEPQWVVDFQQALLTRARVSNFDGRPEAWELTAAFAERPKPVRTLRDWLAAEIAHADRVVVKDPRTAWLLPLWDRVAADLGVDISFVTMLRPPPEVVASARQWYGPARHESSRVAGWVNVMLETERATRGRRRAYLQYADLTASWRPCIERAAGRLGVGVDLSPERVAAVDALIDPALHRQQVGWDEVELPAGLREVAVRAWTTLAALPEGDGEPELAAELDAVRAAYHRLYADAERIAAWSIAAARAHERDKHKKREATS